MRDFLWEKLVSYIKNNRCDYVYVNRQKHLYECLIACLRKSTSEIGTTTFGIFLFHQLFFWKHLFKSIIYCKTVCAFRPFTYICCENYICFSAFSLFTQISLALFCLDHYQTETACSALHLCHCWEKAHWCMKLWQLMSYI